MAVSVVFAGNGVLFASLFARLPEVQARLALGDGELGLALLGAPVGLVAAVWPAGAWISRAGSRRVGVVAGAGYVVALALPSLAGGLGTLLAAMCALGATSGMLDVAMNAQGVTVERAYPRRIFSSLHAAFSFGVLAGALSGGLVAEAGVPLTAHLVATGGLVGAAFAAAFPVFLPDGEGGRTARARRGLRAADRPAARARRRRALHAARRGRAQRLERGLPGRRPRRRPRARGGRPRGVLGRDGRGPAVGDPLAERIGGARLARSGLLVAAAGFAGAALAPGAAAALAAFVTLGLGLAAVYPLCLRLATEQPGVSAAGAIAAVTTTGYTGFLAGPPLVGFIAEAASLRTSLAAVGLLCLTATALIGNSSRRRGRPGWLNEP